MYNSIRQILLINATLPSTQITREDYKTEMAQIVILYENGHCENAPEKTNP